MLPPWAIASIILLLGLWAAGGFTSKMFGEALIERPVAWLTSVGLLGFALTTLIVISRW